MIEEPEQSGNVSNIPVDVRNPVHDRFSIWSIAVIVLVVLYSLFSNNLQDSLGKSHAKPKVATSERVTTDTFGQLVKIDGEVKEAYLNSYIDELNSSTGLGATESISGSKLGRRAIRRDYKSQMTDALNESMSGLRSSPSSTYFARRVILIRAALQLPPLAPIPWTHKFAGLASPLDAYELSAKGDPEFSAQIRQQEAIWKNMFTQRTIPPSQVPVLLAQIRQHPTLLFYGLIADQYVYRVSGHAGKAAQLGRYLQLRAALSMGGTAGVGLFAFCLFIGGVAVWIGSLGALPALRRSGATGRVAATVSYTSPPNFFNRFIVPLPERISNGDRKLRAGDLLDGFAIYLLTLNLFSLLITFVLGQLPHPKFSRMSDIHVIYWEIGVTLLAYVGGSFIALLFVIYKAARKGASLSLELGLTWKGALKNLLYGGVGWGASILFMFAVNIVLDKALHKLPAPANPALPMLAFAPDTISRFLLYGMAAIAAPFFEETFFRGVLLNALLLRFKPLYACLLTGFLFGSIHPVGVLDALVLASLGAIFAWMAYIRKSLAPSMFAHFLQNSFAYLMVYFCFALLARW